MTEARMQYADLMRPEEDWRELGDQSERRKLQNRLAQRAYRRNMRERATKIEELKSQLRIYEELHLPIGQDEDNASHPRGSVPMPPAEERRVDSWCPTPQFMDSLAPDKEHHPASYHCDTQFNRSEQPGGPSVAVRQPISSPRPATRQRMECWRPPHGERSNGEPMTPASCPPMEGTVKAHGTLPPIPASLFTSQFENSAFDLSELGDESHQLTSLLHLAVAGNHMETVKVLLQDPRIAVNEKDCDGFTPLQRAVMNGKSEVVKLLLEHSTNKASLSAATQPLGPAGAFSGMLGEQWNCQPVQTSM